MFQIERATPHKWQVTAGGPGTTILAVGSTPTDAVAVLRTKVDRLALNIELVAAGVRATVGSSGDD